MTDSTDEQIEAAVQRAWSKIGSNQLPRRSEPELESVVLRVWGRLDSALEERFSESELDRLSHLGAEGDLDYWSEEVDGLNSQFDQITGRFHSSPYRIRETLERYKINHEDYHSEDCEWLYQELKRIEIERARRFYAKYRDWESQLHHPTSNIVSKANLATAELKFSELYRQFIDFKIKSVNLSSKMQTDYQRQYNDVIDLMGDQPITEMGRSKLKDFILTQYRYLPKRNLKPYKNKKASELLLLEDIPEQHLIADKTVSDLVKMLQGVFAYAVDRGLLAASPVSDLRLGLEKSSPYGAYTKSQVRLMLTAAEKETDWRRWLPLIAAYTGARLGEIVQLRKSDVLKDDETGRYYIRIVDDAGSVKTDAGNRRVPLHRELINAGFLSLVENLSDVIFPELKSAAVTAWFPIFRERLGIPDKDDMNSRLVFHSFRHSFVTNARSNGILDPGLVQDVVGHEKVNVGITSRYTHQHSISDLCRVVDAISYAF